ncbi:unnamed protein product [Cyprideis torosa]|uniref:Uncharacterized protein n=1 Tax=Cyprideis torosa TaxID=163714 RepID=A0A7R8WCZ0_9CRUS|nr:unnamed protein product [Cyprideis torosa]CAG0893993.1 unnamed protein product [Cyprideis torosa]
MATKPKQKKDKSRCILYSIGRCHPIDRGGSAFSFPSDPIARKQWLVALKWPQGAPVPDGARLCENHFDKAYISIMSNGTKRLVHREVMPIEVMEVRSTTTRPIRAASDDSDITPVCNCSGRSVPALEYSSLSSTPAPKRPCDDSPQPNTLSFQSENGDEASVVNPLSCKYLIIEKVILEDLLKRSFCVRQRCFAQVVKVTQAEYHQGAVIKYKLTCMSGHTEIWSSSSSVGRNKHPVNTEIVSATLTCGGSVTTSVEVATALSLCWPSESTFYCHQAAYVLPAINDEYLKRREIIVEKHRGKELVVTRGKVLVPWKKSIANHVWYSIKTCGGNFETLQATWFSLLKHLSNVHTDCHHQKRKTREDRTKYIRKNDPALKKLESIISRPALLKQLDKAKEFHFISQLESFRGLLMKYCNKRRHFQYPSMISRFQLAVMDHNENVGRPRKMSNEEKELPKEICRKPIGVHKVGPALAGKTYSFREEIKNTAVGNLMKPGTVHSKQQAYSASLRSEYGIPKKDCQYDNAGNLKSISQINFLFSQAINVTPVVDGKKQLIQIQETLDMQDSRETKFIHQCYISALWRSQLPQDFIHPCLSLSHFIPRKLHTLHQLPLALYFIGNTMLRKLLTQILDRITEFLDAVMIRKIFPRKLCPTTFFTADFFQATGFSMSLKCVHLDNLFTFWFGASDLHLLEHLTQRPSRDMSARSSPVVFIALLLG